MCPDISLKYGNCGTFGSPWSASICKNALPLGAGHRVVAVAAYSMTVVLCVVFSQLLGLKDARYAPDLVAGLTFWGFMTSAVVMQGCHSFFQAESYIREHRLPLAIYPLRTTFGDRVSFPAGLRHC